MKALREVVAFIMGDDLRLSGTAIIALLLAYSLHDTAHIWLLLPLVTAAALLVCVTWRPR